MKHSQVKDRAFYMTNAQKMKMGTKKRCHFICKGLTGVARPGKTAKDRALRSAT